MSFSYHYKVKGLCVIGKRERNLKEENMNANIKWHTKYTNEIFKKSVAS